METNKTFLLQRRLNGNNFITEHDSLEINGSRMDGGDAVINFYEFLKKHRLDGFETNAELAQVLKIPHEQFIKLIEAGKNGQGYVTIDASKNIISYLRVRLNLSQISYLQRQHGEAGIKNKSED